MWAKANIKDKPKEKESNGAVMLLFREENSDREHVLSSKHHGPGSDKWFCFKESLFVSPQP